MSNLNSDTDGEIEADEGGAEEYGVFYLTINLKFVA